MANPQAKTADFKNNAKQATADTSNVIETWFTQSQANFEKISQSYSGGGREQVEAFVKAGTAVTRGFEEALKTWTSLAQSTTALQTQAFQTLLGARSLAEITETQNRLARECADSMLGGLSSLSELAVRVTTEALAPLQAQATETLRKAQAA